GREQVGQVGIVHRVPAVLDDDGLARELADIRQRLREHDRLLARGLDTRIATDHAHAAATSGPRAAVRLASNTPGLRICAWLLTMSAGSRRRTLLTGGW